jgi:tRNA(Arg) A34 adenosine deaminase TadA
VGREDNMERRRALLGGFSLVVVGRSTNAQSIDHRPFVARAAAMRNVAIAAGDQPFGAIIVRDGAIVVETPSRVVTTGDPTAHAEMEAIRDAARALGTRRLTGCVMYSTSSPCAMCHAAAYWAGLDRLYHGDGPTDLGAPGLPRF